MGYNDAAKCANRDQYGRATNGFEPIIASDLTKRVCTRESVREFVEATYISTVTSTSLSV